MNPEKEQRRLKPLLASVRVTEEQNYVEKRNSLAYEYVEFFENLGYQLILIPANTSCLESYLEMDYAGIVLTGGNTVVVGNHLESAGEDSIQGVYPERDQIESALIDHAVETQIPLLGICRGMQMINVHLGGSIQHLIKGHVARDHQLVSANSLLSGTDVNSYHNDGMFREDVAESMEIIATTEDGVVEAVQHDTLPILGIQWHPERQTNPIDRRIVEDLFTLRKTL